MCHSPLIPLFYLVVKFWNALLSLYFPNQSANAFIAETNLPTTKGVYRVRSYRNKYDPKEEPTAIIFGKVEGLENVPLRVHDACFTSEVLGSKKCDCKEQLDYAVEYIKQNGPGIVIYLQQEGRGIGLANKIAAYALQEEGYDTVDANRMLGLPDDIRDYTPVRDILNDLQIKSIQLLTNNPRKIEKLTSLGIKISSRIAVQMEPNEINRNYLKTKAEKMAHLLDNVTTTTSEPASPLLMSKNENEASVAVQAFFQASAVAALKDSTISASLTHRHAHQQLLTSVY